MHCTKIRRLEDPLFYIYMQEVNIQTILQGMKLSEMEGNVQICSVTTNKSLQRMTN